MAHGRPDYYTGQNVGLNKPFTGLEEFYEFDSGNIVSEGVHDYIEYTVPANRVLYVTTLHISAFSLALNSATVYADFVIRDLFTWIREKNVYLTPASFYVIDAGEVFRVRLYNADEFQITAFVMALGVLDKVTV